MNIQLLLTGNELMSGDTVDSNSAMIAQKLAKLSLRIRRKVTVGDDLRLLVEQLQQLSQSSEILLINGGLGPTDDDMTATALARLIEKPLVEHPQALSHLRNWCKCRGASLNTANLKQTLLPEGSEIIPNPRGSAVGFRLRHNDCEILCTPGVPSELNTMLEQSIVPWLGERSDPSEAMLTLRFHTFGLGESTLQQWINDQIPELITEVELGFRAGAPTLEVKLSSPAASIDRLHHYRTKLKSLIGDYIVAEGGDCLAQTLINRLKALGKRVTTAESCTGGLIASMLTRQAGASAVFEAGFVTYADTIKARVLGVSPATLATQGAVSESVVREMAQGALQASGADYAIAVSGIAGPDGGTSEKPAGTAWVAWGDQQRIETACLYYPYDRTLFQTMIAGASLDLLRRFTSGITSPPRYLKERRPPEGG